MLLFNENGVFLALVVLSQHSRVTDNRGRLNIMTIAKVCNANATTFSYVSFAVHLCAAEFRELFAVHDSDSDGWIPLNDMTSVLRDIGVTVTEDEIVHATSGNINSSNAALFLIACSSSVVSFYSLIVYSFVCCLSSCYF